MTDQDEPQMRVTQRTYSGDASPLADVLVMLYDWSVERRLRLAIEKSAELWEE